MPDHMTQSQGREAGTQGLRTRMGSDGVDLEDHLKILITVHFFIFIFFTLLCGVFLVCF